MFFARADIAHIDRLMQLFRFFFSLFGFLSGPFRRLVGNGCSGVRVLVFRPSFIRHAMLPPEVKKAE